MNGGAPPAASSSYMHKSRSYNHYTMREPPASLVLNGLPNFPRASMPHLPQSQQQPQLPPPPHLSPHPPPPPRPPPPAGSTGNNNNSGNNNRTTSTPQSTPVGYEDFAEGLNSSLRAARQQSKSPQKNGSNNSSNSNNGQSDSAQTALTNGKTTVRKEAF